MEDTTTRSERARRPGRATARRGALRTRAAGLFPGAGPPPPASPRPASGEDASEERGAEPLPRRLRLRLAAGERLPRSVRWVRRRCGMELRTLAALAVLLLTAAGFAVHHLWSSRPQRVAAVEPVPGPAPTGLVAESSAGSGSGAAPSALPSTEAGGGAGAGGTGVVVDVAGEVREPGVYTLPAGSRVADALEAAGGSRPGTDTDTLNRARALVDGEQILVGATPTAGPAGPADPGGPGGPGGAAGPGAPGAAGPVSLNAATPEQLETLPGIGPVLAAHIVGYRQDNGGFTTVDQLLEVSGIGESRLAELRDHVTL